VCYSPFKVRSIETETMRGNTKLHCKFRGTNTLYYKCLWACTIHNASRDGVPSNLRLGLNLVLFFVTILNTLSSSALEWGSVRMRSATEASLANENAPSGVLSAFK